VTNKDPYKGNKVSTGFTKYMQKYEFSNFKLFKENFINVTYNAVS